MARNQVYLDNFYADLANKKFDMIVTAWFRPSHKIQVIGTTALVEENNIFANSVVKYIECNYDLSQSYYKLGLMLWVPKVESTC